MNGLTTAPNRHACAHYGAQQACMCSPRRPTSCASEAHPRTMGIGAMLGAMRLAVWRLPQTTEAVCSTTVGLRSVPAATFPPRAARADEQCTVRIIRAPYINSRRARYDGMSRLDEDVPTGLALLARPFDRPTPATPTVWYRARTNFPSRRAVGSRVSRPARAGVIAIPRTYGAPGGRGGVGRRESAVARRALRLDVDRPLSAGRPGRARGEVRLFRRPPSSSTSSSRRYRDRSPVWVPDAHLPDFGFRFSHDSIFGPSATATAHTSQIDVIYTHITSWRWCTR
jgi:hypothetical protein